MYISSILLLISITVGLIASIYLLRGTLSTSVELIREQTGRATRGIGNFILAKSMIVQKSQTVCGFFLLLFAFIFQLINFFLNEAIINKKLHISLSILILTFTVIVTVLIVETYINYKEEKDGIEYVRLLISENPNEFWNSFGKANDAYCREITDLMCIDRKYLKDTDTLQKMMREKLNR